MPATEYAILKYQGEKEFEIAYSACAKKVLDIFDGETGIVFNCNSYKCLKKMRIITTD